METLEYDKIVKFIREEDIKFIRLAFFDLFGVQKNISIVSGELQRAFEEGISFDASSVAGFGDEVKSDLFLFPDASTLSILPWRPSDGRVARMYCDIRYPDGRIFEKDSRYILKNAVKTAEEKGLKIGVGPEMEFYLFKLDEQGAVTKIPFDHAGYLDIAPEDKGENVRREICFYMRDMGIQPESSHHASGPGQNEVDFHYSDPLSSADNTATFKWIVRTTAESYGLHADFSPKPMAGESGNGMHINISVESQDGRDHTEAFMSGIMEYIREMTLFLNPSVESYQRFGEKKAPKYITWSPENRSQLVRIPASGRGKSRIELRSPDPLANPYLAFALLIHAGLEGVEKGMRVKEPTNINLYTAKREITDRLLTLPLSLAEAGKAARNSAFIKRILPENYLETYGKGENDQHRKG